MVSDTPDVTSSSYLRKPSGPCAKQTRESQGVKGRGLFMWMSLDPVRSRQPRVADSLPIHAVALLVAGHTNWGVHALAAWFTKRTPSLSPLARQIYLYIYRYGGR